MSMAEELADTHAAESADIGATADAGVIGREAPERVETPDKPLSIRDGIKAAQKEVEARTRDDKGKFAPKAAPVEAAAEIPKTEKDVQPTQALNPDGPPPSWSKEAQPVWDTLSQEAKAVVRKREADFQKGIEKYTQKSSQYDEISQALAPVRPLLQQSGIQTDAQAVTRLLEWEGSFRNPQTRMQAFNSLARQYGIDLQSLAQGSQAPQGQELPEHLRPILDQFGQLAQTVQTMQSRDQEREQQHVADTLTSFAKDKPHFEKVRVRMGQMMAAGIASPADLDGAYQQAVWADPELRESLLKEQDEKRQAEFTKAQAAAGKNARIAAISPAPKGRVGSSVANGHDKGGSIRDSIMAAKKELEENQRA